MINIYQTPAHINSHSIKLNWCRRKCHEIKHTQHITFNICPKQLTDYDHIYSLTAHRTTRQSRTRMLQKLLEKCTEPLQASLLCTKQSAVATTTAHTQHYSSCTAVVHSTKQFKLFNFSFHIRFVKVTITQVFYVQMHPLCVVTVKCWSQEDPRQVQ